MRPNFRQLAIDVLEDLLPQLAVIRSRLIAGEITGADHAQLLRALADAQRALKALTLGIECAADAAREQPAGGGAGRGGD